MPFPKHEKSWRKYSLKIVKPEKFAVHFETITKNTFPKHKVILIQSIRVLRVLLVGYSL